jgi:hypothetical protein
VTAGAMIAAPRPVVLLRETGRPPRVQNSGVLSIISAPNLFRYLTAEPCGLHLA